MHIMTKETLSIDIEVYSVGILKEKEGIGHLSCDIYLVWNNLRFQTLSTLPKVAPKDLGPLTVYSSEVPSRKRI